MAYGNNYRLKVEGETTKPVKTPWNCDLEPCTFTYTEDLSQNFCGKCGASLVQSEMVIDPTSSHVIKDFVRSYKEAGQLLKENGSGKNSGSGFNICQELREFSTKYPDLTFILICKWDSGLLEDGDPSTDHFFFKNGEEKRAEVKTIYVNPFTEEEYQWK